MIQVYDADKKRITVIDAAEDMQITTTLSTGDKQLSFKYPKNGASAAALACENYIRTATDEFVIKEIQTGEDKNEYHAALNVEELEGQKFPYGFASQTQTVRACLEFAFDGTGWTVGTCEITKRRTIDIEESCSAWDVLQDVLKTYLCECTIDSIQKVVNIYETIGQDRGAYIMERLNLRKLTYKADTYDFYTRIYPIGKDGITPEILLGVPYIDNHQYSDKVISRYWKDERYTVTTSLIEDATARLAEASRPYVAYQADVVDLAAQTDEYDVLAFGIGDTVTLVSKTENVKEKQRIVKLTEYPKQPEKNTCELSSTSKTFAQVQEATKEKAVSDAVEKSTSQTKKILNEDYWTYDETQTAITSSAEEIKTEASRTYQTKTDAATEKGELQTEIRQTAESITSTAAATYETKTDATTKQANLQSQIQQTAESITSTVSATYETKTDAASKQSSLQSQITQNAGNIELKVNASGVIAAINVSAESSGGSAVKISADKVDLSGYVTISNLSTSGKTTINGDNITTGTVKAERIRLYGKMDVFKDSTSFKNANKGGSIGYLSGEHTYSNGTTEETNGMALMSRSGDNYIIVTDAGVRMTAAYNNVEYKAYLADGHFYAPTLICGGKATIRGIVTARDHVTLYDSDGANTLASLWGDGYGGRLYIYDVDGNMRGGFAVLTSGASVLELYSDSGDSARLNYTRLSRMIRETTHEMPYGTSWGLVFDRVGGLCTISANGGAFDSSHPLAAGAWTTIGTLPEAYRPSRERGFYMTAMSGASPGPLLNIETDGTVKIYNYSSAAIASGWLRVDGTYKIA